MNKTLNKKILILSTIVVFSVLTFAFYGYSEHTKYDDYVNLPSGEDTYNESLDCYEGINITMPANPDYNAECCLADTSDVIDQVDYKRSIFREDFTGVAGYCVFNELYTNGVELPEQPDGN